MSLRKTPTYYKENSSGNHFFNEDTKKIINANSDWAQKKDVNDLYI